MQDTHLHHESHLQSSDLLTDVVIGMSDGLTVPFALAAGLSGAVHGDVSIVWIAGIAEIAAGSIAMGLGGYLAGKTEQDHYASELKNEYWELTNKREAEIQEVRKVFLDWGLSKETAEEATMEIIKDDKRASEVIHRLRALVQKKEQTDPEPVCLNELVRDAERLLHSHDQAQVGEAVPALLVLGGGGFGELQVVQVQQFLTDVSATRGQDGLDDGFDEAAKNREAFLAASDAIRDTGRVSLWMWAGAWGKGTAKPVYLYYWTHAAPGANHDFAGAYHGSEISYPFGNPRATEPWVDEDRRISDVMNAYWSNYAKTGNPNGAGLPTWAAYDGKTEQVMELGDRFQAIPLADKAKVDFWKRFYQTQPAN